MPFMKESAESRFDLFKMYTNTDVTACDQLRKSNLIFVYLWMLAWEPFIYLREWDCRHLREYMLILADFRSYLFRRSIFADFNGWTCWIYAWLLYGECRSVLMQSMLYLIFSAAVLKSRRNLLESTVWMLHPTRTCLHLRPAGMADIQYLPFGSWAGSLAWQDSHRFCRLKEHNHIWC